MLDQELTRRRFLEGSAGVVAVAAVAGLPSIASAAESQSPEALIETLVVRARPGYSLSASSSQLSAGIQSALKAASPTEQKELTQTAARLLAYDDGVLATADAPQALVKLSELFVDLVPWSEIVDPVLDAGRPDPKEVAAANAQELTEPPVPEYSAEQEEAKWILNATRSLLSRAAGGAQLDIHDFYIVRA